ncbi:cupin domain-containing protein [Sedimentimonas flavescens]|uniref:Cupin domain-containing protein n=1 Tax=Sedimentimonas flavescens TaxID=2851012 RepID=A0ABT3A2Y5_9RHOB|nr:cupin domain-containing protein [Sedimentimonas flavescens]MCV2880317.1 cupin domain-containing protein [Sedimentimonas flavescens]
MKRPTRLICISAAILTAACPTLAQQTEPIKRTPLQRFEVPQTSYETIIGLAELAPDVNVGRHTHPGPESGYVIEGGFELLVDGEAPRQISAGESYLVPAMIVHDAKTGPNGAKVIATYLVPDGKPTSSPAN